MKSTLDRNPTSGALKIGAAIALALCALLGTLGAAAFSGGRVALAQGNENGAVALVAETVAAGTSSLAAAGAGSPLPTTQPAPASTTGLLIVKMADTGSEDPYSVYTGERVTYTLAITNQAASTLTEILIMDSLPVDTLDQIVCTPPPSGVQGCDFVAETNYIPEPSGGTVVVTATRQISWSLPSLAPGQGLTLAFSARVVGQPEGAQFTNWAFASYIQDGIFRSANSNPVDLIAHLRVTADGGASISSVPTWFSDDMGGTISQDWGDFDHDGDLDLVLGSSLGTTVYENDKGILEAIWTSPLDDERFRLSYGVRWADVVPDTLGNLDLVVVGNSADGSASGAGLNYIYTYDAGRGDFTQHAVFTSPYQLVRVAPGDYDGDGDLDLVASTNAINAPDLCPVLYLVNAGAGRFQRSPECLSPYATAALGPIDIDKDGDLDLVLGVFPGTLTLLNNNRSGQVITNSNPFTTAVPIVIEDDLEYLPYDLAWGDFDRDGDLDLAAAYPMQRQVRIYRNQYKSVPSMPLAPLARPVRTGPFMTPLAVEWADFNGDGRLELAVADSPPALYNYVAATDSFQQIESVTLPANSGQIWSMRGAGIGTNNNLDLVMSNRDGPSQIFSSFAARLRNNLTYTNTRRASSVAWGDWDGDGDLDLLLGGPPGDLFTYLYINKDGILGSEEKFAASGFGPHAVAFGDVNNDGLLDVAIGTPAGLQIYLNEDTTSPAQIIATERPVRSLAWADYDDDGYLDLLLGCEGGPVYLYPNDDGALTVTPTLAITEAGDVRSLAWADYDNDYYLDFAVGVDGAPARVYHNDGDGSFSLAWRSPVTASVRAVAWADYDQDGDVDLAIGHYDADDLIGENVMAGGVYSFTTFAIPVPAGVSSRTTSLAWGDWNNDGTPDLAAGKGNSPSIVYANLTPAPGSPQFIPLWQSGESYAVTGVAWGDRDGDGDLDLATSQQSSGGRNGFYENTLGAAAHLPKATPGGAALLNNPPYLSIDRPGATDAAYFYSSPDIVGGPRQPTVTVQYRLYDAEGDPVAGTIFEYSLGRGQWRSATRAAGSPAPITQTSPSGVIGVFVWDAAADQAVSDNARFRIRVISHNDVGPVQRASTVAVSPPFRVRGQSCYWPTGITISANPEHPLPGQEVQFSAQLESGSGALSARWDFGDGSTITSGWKVRHTYTGNGAYTVSLTVIQESVPIACPLTRPGYATRRLAVGTGVPDRLSFLPLVLRDSTGITTTPSTSTTLLLPAPPTVRPAVQIRPRPTAYTPAYSPPTTTHPAVRASQDSAGAGIWSRATASPNTASGAVQITNFALGVNSQPALNADGSRVAFWTTGRLTGHNPDGNIEIFEAEIRSNNTVRYSQVTSSTGSILAGFNLAPSVDEAGERIAFFSDRDLVPGGNPEHNFEVFLADRRSGTLRLTQLTSTARGVNVLPTISGDGDSVVFASDQCLASCNGWSNPDGNQEIFLTTLHAGGQISYTQVTSSTGGINDQPAANTDGSIIAFVSDRDLTGDNPDLNHEIFLAYLDPGGQISYTQVTRSDGGLNEQPSLSADGRFVAFVSDCDLTGQNPTLAREVFLAEVPALGIEPDVRQISDIAPGMDKDQPTISADGTRVAFITVSTRRMHLYDLVAGADASRDTGTENGYPALSADGTVAAFTADWDVYLTRYPLANLSVAKVVTPSATAAGERLTYTLVVTNNGPTPAGGATLVDNLPPGLEVRSMTMDDYVDDDGWETGFGGGTHFGTAATADGLTLVSTSSLPLPNNHNANGWVDMAANQTLLHFDETSGTTARDSAYGRDYSCTSGGTWGEGQIGGGRVFPGTGPCSFYNASFYYNFGRGPLSIGMWFKQDADSSSTQTLFDWGRLGDGTKPNWFRIHLNSDSSVWAGFSAGSSSGSVGSSAGLQKGAWHFLVVTLDEVASNQHNGQMHLYVDGELVSDGWMHFPQGGSDDLSLIDGTVDLGSSFNYNGYSWYPVAQFRGTLDEFFVLGRALTADEIARVYQLQAADRAGYFVSRVMADSSGRGVWSAIDWLPTRVVGEQLPDLLGSDSGYPAGTEGTIDSMAGNLLLLHVDEPAGATAFLDTSGAGNDAYCAGTTCPMASSGGWLGSAVRFDGEDDYLDAGDGVNLANTSFSIEFWVRQDDRSRSSGILATSPSALGIVDFRVSLATGSLKWESQGATLETRGRAPQAFSGLAWHHAALTYDATTRRRAIYVDGTLIVTDTVTADYQGASRHFYIGGPPAESARTSVSLDELAVYDRLLSAEEVRSHYLRSAMNVQFQVRGCQNADCSDNPTFVGPGGAGTFHRAGDDGVLAPPAFALDLPRSPYFQYRTLMDVHISQPLSLSQAITLVPSIPLTLPLSVRRVTVSPLVACEGSGPITCTLGSATAPLALNTPITIVLPVTVTSRASIYATPMASGGLCITNTVSASSDATDRDPADNNAYARNTLSFVPVAAMTITGPITGLLSVEHTFTTTVEPLNVSAVITYVWQVTDIGSITHTYDLTETQSSWAQDVQRLDWSNHGAGTKFVNVSVTNGVEVVTDTHRVEIDTPFQDVTLSGDTPTALGQASTFTATIDGSGTRVLYLWDFGDGVTQTTTSHVITYTYSTPDAYTVTVTAYNAVSQHSDSEPLLVESALIGLGLSSNSPIKLGVQAVLTATPIPASATNVIYAWSLGDGTTASGSDRVLTHPYARTSLDPEVHYTVVVTAQNATSLFTATLDLVSLRSCWVHVEGTSSDAGLVYNVLQDGIDAAPSGGLVQVAGTCDIAVDHPAYSNDRMVVAYISKTLTLQGGYTYTNWALGPDWVARPTTLDGLGQNQVVYVINATGTTVEGLQVIRGRTPSGSDGGGIYVSGQGITVTHNIIRDNWAGSRGGGLYVYPGNSSTGRAVAVIDNVIRSNTSASDGGGIYVRLGRGALHIAANQIVSNTASRAGGVALLGGSNPQSDRRTVANNVVAENTCSTGTGCGLYASASYTDTSANLTLLHNTFVHNTIPGNTGPSTGIQAGPGSVLTLTNSIVAGHDTAVAVSPDQDGYPAGVMSVDGVLWHNNAQNRDPAQPIAVTHEYAGAPGFVDPAAGDYHITMGSPAIDKGVPITGVTTDMDGGPRTVGKAPDLGADELSAGLDGSLSVTPALARAGTVVTYTLTVRNNGTVGFTADITAQHTLPGSVLPPASRSWNSVNFPGGHTWIQVFTATITPGYAGPLFNLATISTDQPGVSGSLNAASDAVDCHARVGATGSIYPTVQEAVDAAGSGGNVRVAGTCSGVLERAGQEQVVYITKTLTVQGGYTTTNWSVSNPQANPTTLDALGRGRVAYISATQGSMVNLSGLRFTGGITPGNGGGVYARGAQFEFRQNEVIDNSAEHGGGIYATDCSSVVLERNLLRDNTAHQSGGGAALLDTPGVRLLANQVLSNTAGSTGAGIALNGTTTPILTNNIFAYNHLGSGSGQGGGVYLGNTGAAQLRHNTFAQNSGGCYASCGQAVYVDLSSSAALTNTIVTGHGNVAVYAESVPVPPNPYTRLYHTFWGGSGTASIGGQVSVDGFDYGGDPAFADLAAGDFHLRASSAARNHGLSDMSAIHDIDQETRDATPDLGADEYMTFLIVSKSATPSPAQAGAPLTYTILLTNTGHAPFDARITDTLPNAHASPGGVHAWNVNSLMPGQVWTQQVTVTPDWSYSGTLTNVVQARDLGGGGAYDDFTLVTPVTVTPRLEAIKQVNRQTVPAGQPLLYTIRITNTGNVDLHATVTDTITPAGAVLSAQEVWSSLLIPAPGGIWGQNLNVTVNPSFLGTLTNTVQVATAEGVSATYAVTTEVLPTPALAIGHFVHPSTVQAGERLTYTLRITNTGNVALNDIAMTDALHRAVTTTDRLNWSSLFLDPGASLTKTVIGTVAWGYGGPLTNTMRVTASGVTPLVNTLSHSAATTPNLAVGKFLATTGTIYSGGRINYTVRVTNTGNVTLTNVTITDSVTPAGAVSTPAMPLVLSAGTLGRNGTWSQTFPLTVAGSFSGTLTNHVLASAQGVTRSASAPAVEVHYPLFASKTAVRTPQGTTPRTVTYTLSLTNGGSVTMRALITDALSLGNIVTITAECISPTTGCACTVIDGKHARCIWSTAQTVAGSSTWIGRVRFTFSDNPGTVTNQITVTTQEGPSASYRVAQNWNQISQATTLRDERGAEYAQAPPGSVHWPGRWPVPAPYHDAGGRPAVAGMPHPPPGLAPPRGRQGAR